MNSIGSSDNRECSFKISDGLGIVPLRQCNLTKTIVRRRTVFIDLQRRCKVLAGFSQMISFEKHVAQVNRRGSVVWIEALRDQVVLDRFKDPAILLVQFRHQMEPAKILRSK